VVFCFLSCDDKYAEEDDEGSYTLGEIDSFPEEVVVGNQDEDQSDRSDKHRDRSGALCQMRDFQERVVHENEKKTSQKGKARSHNEMPVKNHFDGSEKSEVSTDECT